MLNKFLRMIVVIGLGIVFNKIFSSTNTIVGDLKTYKHVIPYIYTVGLVEISSFILGTTMIALIIYGAYHKSRSSQKEIFKKYSFILEIEILIGLFIVGTQIFSNEKIFIVKQLTLIFFILIGFLFFYSVIYEKATEDKKIILEKDTLYKSRKPLLRAIDEYLESMNSFSIIGKWGIGKTKLIENFFYGDQKDFNSKSYKEKYKMLYIDTSIYSNNQKIVEAIEDGLSNLFRKYKILKKPTSFINELFTQNNNFLMGVYQYIFSNGTVYEEREKIRKKVQEIKYSYNKVVVICLDNLERLGAKERIVELFAIVSEILPDNIKKIYLYEEEEMIKIFEKDEGFNFIEYMEKYTFNKVEIREISVDEVLKSNKLAKELIEKIITRCDDQSLKGKIKSKVQNTIDKTTYLEINEYMNNLDREFTQKLKNIKLKIKNPRYLENLLNYLKPSEGNLEEYQYRLEYKITRDFLSSITNNEFKIEKFFDTNLFDYSRTIKLKIGKKQDKISNENIESNKLEQLCIYYLFKIDDDGDLIRNFNRKSSYFEMFFENKGTLNRTEEYQKLEKLKKEPKKNILKILKQIAFIYPDKYIDESKEYLKTQKNLEYKISNRSELNDLIFLEELEEISTELCSIIKIEISKDELEPDSLLISNENIELIINYYIFRNKYIIDFVQLIAGDLHGYLNKEFSEIQIFLAKIPTIGNVDGFVERLETELVNRKNELRELKIDEKIKKILKTYKQLKKISKESIILENKLSKVNSNIFKLSRKDILNMLDSSKENFEIDARYYSQKIEIRKDQVDEYIELLKDDFENPKFTEGVRILLIELLKFKEKDN